MQFSFKGQCLGRNTFFVVISKPDDDDATICEGEGAVFTCVLNSNVGDSVQWYRYIMDTGTLVAVDPSEENITILTHTGNTLTSSLTVTNAIISYTGYYWVGTPSVNVCNVSLTVSTSMYV